MDLDDNSGEYMKHRYYFNEMLLRKRRQTIWLLMAISIFATLFWICISLIPPTQGILRTHEAILQCQAEGMSKIPQLEGKMVNLEKRLALATSTSIDARIQAIEKSLQVNELSAEEISSLNDVRKELATIKGYLFDDPNEVIQFKQLQSDYHQLSDQQNRYATKDDVQAQIANLQTILTVSLTFLGILFTVFFGSWWFVGRKVNSVSTPTTPVTSEDN
jgi:hypothetical protein